MCGFVGICNLEKCVPIDAETIGRMSSSLRHRGPDQSGIYLDDSIGLGHRRLSIIDPGRGVQPIGTADGSMWIVYNGETFNYPELRRDLEGRGCRFATDTDTEVLLYVYAVFGAAGLSLVNGQYAFAIWDARRRRLFMARDRVGVHPLFYAMHNGQLFFASEIKALLTGAAGLQRRIDPVALDQLFTFWSALPGRTVLKGVYELPAGHAMTVENGLAGPPRRYWHVPFGPPESHLTEPAEAIAEQVKSTLIDAVRIRLRSDVPVGCYLSGGLDSSAVTALVKRHFNSEVRTFGMRFTEPGFDEGRHQQAMVSFLNTGHTESWATHELIGNNLEPALWHCETPLLRMSPVPLYLLSRAVQQAGYKVVLTGEGADEIFGGYNIFREAKVREFWARQPESLRRPLLLRKLYPYILDDRRLHAMLPAFFGRGLDTPEDPLFSHQLRWDGTRRLRIFFSEELRLAVGDYDPFADLLQRLPADFGRWDYLARAQYLEMTIFLSNYLLSSQGDRMAMAHSVEIRVPYLDHRLIELAARIPSHMKIRGLREKYILKRAVASLLPPAIAERPKHPYRAPITQSLLRGKTREQTREHLQPRALQETGYFNAGRVQHLLQRLEADGRASEFDSMALCGILTTQMIHNAFVRPLSLPPVRPAAPDRVIDRRSLSERMVTV